MPKRKRDEDDYDYLKKQLRKLKRKIKSGRNRRRDSSSSSISDSPSHHDPRECESIATVNDDVIEPEPGCSYWDDYWPEPDLSDVDDGDALLPDAQPPVATMTAPIAAAATEPSPAAPAAAATATTATAAAAAAAAATVDAATAAAHLPAATAVAVTSPVVLAVPSTTIVATPTVQSTVTVVPSPPNANSSVTTVALTPTPAAVEAPNSTLDPDLLAILGDDPTAIKEYGDDIQNDLAIRLNHLVTSGLSKENRTEIKDKYLIPANCKMIKAPTLNPEIRASLVESQAKRDKGIENKQILNSCALSSLSKAITLLLASDSKNQEVLKLLMDTVRILGDIQHSDSMLRRFFILSTVKKELKDQLEKTKIEDLLFGSNLAETLKSAKTINKTGADMRSSTQTTARAGAPKPAKMSNKPLNSRGPPMSRRPAPSGGTRNWRSTNPAPTSRQTTTKQHSSSRMSSRQQYPRHRR